MRKKTTKQMLACGLSLAMVVTSFGTTGITAEAANEKICLTTMRLKV